MDGMAHTWMTMKSSYQTGDFHSRNLIPGLDQLLWGRAALAEAGITLAPHDAARAPLAGSRVTCLDTLGQGRKVRHPAFVSNRGGFARNRDGFGTPQAFFAESKARAPSLGSLTSQEVCSVLPLRKFCRCDPKPCFCR